MAPGDLGDSRFNLFVLEHVYQWVSGKASSLTSPRIFYPYPWTLFFSDTHAGSVPVYILFRALGASEYFAFNAWFLVGYLTTFVAAYYSIARMGGSPLVAGFAAAVFAFSLPSIAQFGHAQLVYRCGVPLALCYLWLAIRDGSARYLCFSAFWLMLQILFSVYIGMLLFLVMAIFVFAAFFTEQAVRQQKGKLRCFANDLLSLVKSRKAADITLMALLFVTTAMTLTLLGGYAYVSKFYGLSRVWEEVTLELPRPASYLLMSSLPYWAPVSNLLAKNIPMPYEHNMFLGFGVTGLMLVGMLAILRNSQRVLADFPARAMVTTLVIAIALVTITNDGWTAYRAFSYLPGLGAIKAVARIALVLAFPIAIIAVVGLRALLLESSPKFVGGLVALGLCLLTGYEFVTVDRQAFSIVDAERRVDAVVQSAQAQAKGIPSPILLLAARPGEDGALAHLDAMLAAQRMRWKSINGYSGFFPPGAAPDPVCGLAARQVSRYLDWRESHKGGPTFDNADALFKSLVFVGDPSCGRDPLNRSVQQRPSDKLPEKVTLLPVNLHQSGGDVTFKVTVKNANPDLGISMKSPFPYFLSWRFIDANANGPGDLDKDWSPRWALPSDIGPGESLTVEVTGPAPRKPGKYWLEVSMVAENLYWFHSKGMQPLRFPENVKTP